MRPSVVAVASAACIAAAGAGVQAAESVRAGTLTPEMIVMMRSVGEVALSPDGNRVAYVASVPRALDEEPGKAHQEIWVVDTRGGAARRYTPQRQRAWAPAFSPDGRQLAFLSSRPVAGIEDPKDHTDLFVLDLDGGEARPLTQGERSVESFLWSPSGDAVAFVAADPESESEKKDREAGRDWKVEDRDAKPRRLWVQDVAGGAARRVTLDDASVWDFDWSPDASRFVVQVTPTPRVDDSYMNRTLALVPASGGTPAPLVHTEGKLGAVRFSPDGAFVAWLGATDRNDPFAGSVFVVPAAGGAARDLTGETAMAATGLEWYDAETLAVSATRGTRTTLDLVSRRDGAGRTVVDAGIVFTEAAVSRAGRIAAFAASSPWHPTEVFVTRLDKRAAPRRLTTTNPEVESAQLGTQEVVRWPAADGLEIEGVLVRPLGFADGLRYPLVVVVHGGPESCFRNGWITGYNTWAQLLARNGFMVLLPNYRASIGRGNAYERADHGDLAGSEFEDVLAGVDWLEARGWVDPARVGIGGGSYGGYFSAWAATAHSPRFAAAVDFAGITNWISMQGTSDIPEENALVHWNLPFYDNMTLYWERSPLAHVNACRTPLLLMHGEKDARVPIGQATELYTALRLLGREVEFVRYPRAGHGLSETAHRLDAATRALEWFERHLKGTGQSARR